MEQYLHLVKFNKPQASPNITSHQINREAATNVEMEPLPVMETVSEIVHTKGAYCENCSGVCQVDVNKKLEDQQSKWTMARCMLLGDSWF